MIWFIFIMRLKFYFSYINKLTKLIVLPFIGVLTISKCDVLFGLAYRDSISRVLSWLTLFMWGMFLISSKDFNSPTLFNMFRGLITLTLLRFLVKELLTFYIIFELLTLPMAIIIIGWGAQPERVIATLYILLYTIIRSMPFIIVILYFYFRQIPFGLRGLVIIPF